MRLFRFRSVRAKLIATTMLVFGVLLAVLTVVADIGSRQAVFSSIDGDLRRRGEDFARVVVHPGRPIGPPHDSGIMFTHRQRGPDVGQVGGLDFRRDSDFVSMGTRAGMAPGAVSGDRPEIGPDRGPLVLSGTDHGGPPVEPWIRGRDSQWIAPKRVPVADLGDPHYDPSKLAYDPVGFARAAHGETVFRTLYVDGEPRRVFSTPAKTRGQVTDVVQIAYQVGPALDALDSFRSSLLRFVIPIGVLLGGLASFFIVDRLLKPLRQMTMEAGRIGREGFGERLAPLGEDEFASLALTLNGMLGRLEQVYRKEQEINRRLIQTVEQQQRFTSDASHELKTPLSVVKAYVGLLKQSRATVAEEKESIGEIDRAANRMTELIRNLLVLARVDAGNSDLRRRCDLREIVSEAIRGVPGASEQVRFLREGPPMSVDGAPDELARVFVNLIENAFKYSGCPESIEISLMLVGNQVAIEVADCGVGIAPEHLPHVFERFYRPDQSRSSDTGGSGLGLAICEQIVTAHGGKICVESAVGKGTRFTVTLPASASERDLGDPS